MKTKKVLLRVFDEYAVCEDCNVVLEYNPNIMERGKIFYTCPNCGKHYGTTEKYPRRVYETVGQPPKATK